MSYRFWTCRDCGTAEQVSNSANVCPGCGKPIEYSHMSGDNLIASFESECYDRRVDYALREELLKRLRGTEWEVAFGSWLVDCLNEFVGKPEEAGLRIVLNHWSGLDTMKELKNMPERDNR